MAFTAPNTINIASNEAQRIAELSDRQTSYGNEQTASTDQRTKNDAADCAQFCVEAKAYAAGGAASAGNPNPWNPPGQNSRK
jgi:hypothetical protein